MGYVIGNVDVQLTREKTAFYISMAPSTIAKHYHGKVPTIVFSFNPLKFSK